MPTKTGIRNQSGKKAQPLIRSPDDLNSTVFFVGYQEGELVWAGHRIVAVADDHVLLKDAKEWPNMRTVPHTLDSLREGVLHNDDLCAALSLDKAIQVRAELTRRKKARIDKQLNSIMLMQKALAERDQVGLRAMAATQTR